MSSNPSEMVCIDCPVSPCDRESPECRMFGDGPAAGRKLADRIVRAVRAKAGPLPAPKGHRGRKLDFSRLDLAWFRAHARTGKGGSVSVTAADPAEFAAHGLPLKPIRMGKSWRCNTRNAYLSGLLLPEAPREECQTSARQPVEQLLSAFPPPEKTRSDVRKVIGLIEEVSDGLSFLRCVSSTELHLNGRAANGLKLFCEALTASLDEAATIISTRLRHHDTN